MTDLALSVLDLIPVRTGQSTTDALAATLSLARVAEDVGVRRYWVAEHHNMPSVASTNPAVLTSLIASATSSMRVGSGGVMLPNHAPLVVAEQFALLEAAFPGRIDLGIGRAPGSDPVTAWAMRQGDGEAAVADFPDAVSQVEAMMSPSGVDLRIGARRYGLKATPVARQTPPVWLLGSSDYSARLAASRGLPYVFAHHFAGRGAREAMALYRDTYQPSERYPEPSTFMTVNVCVGESAEDAWRLARPYLYAIGRLRTGGTLQLLDTVESAHATPPPAPEDLLTDLARDWLIGDAATVTAGMRELAARFDVDEVMVHVVTGASGSDPIGRTPAREQTLRALAAELAG